MDAASHRGIDDARELREKAMYAPASSRYKVYIIDEAHQLTVDAANALLKLIEEPPPHLRFVFATTEPDKILATIRSRTHHYPYRLVSARRLQEHLAWICEQEGVPAEPEALALVARAGAGSVRDALSILGQLVAGTGPEGLTYADAVAQLGVTDATMLDEVVDALAAGDGAQMFSVVDRVVEAGLDPRRFAADLLERLRDLVVLHEVPDAVDAGLLDAPDSQIETMRRQNEHLGLAQLSRAADLVSTGLSELKGATAPRLQLELLCARLLLPAIDDTDSGLLARLDRLEHRIAYLGDADAAPVAAPTARPVTRPVAPAAGASPAPVPAPTTESGPPEPTPPLARPAAHTSAAAPVGTGGPPAPPRLSTVAPSTAPPAEPLEAATPPVVPATLDAPVASAPHDRPAPAPAADTTNSAVDLGPVVLRWPAVLEALKAASRVAHTLADGAVPLSRTATTLVLAHPDKVRLAILRANTGHMELLRLAVLDVLHLDVDVDLVLDPDKAAAAAAVVAGTPSPTPVPAAPATAPAGPSARERANAVVAEEKANHVEPEEDVASSDDPDADGDLSGLALVQRELGGTVMTEYDNG
jgi:DNA polymerase-3 subunit gamma/tau